VKLICLPYCIPPFLTGYKYYAVYMPLVVIQWLLAYRCAFASVCPAASIF
jgi:ABC-type Fe3+ transport system permease subunit